MDQPKDKKPLNEALEQFWSQALGRVTQAEDEARELVQRVSQMAGWSQDEVKRHARDLADRLLAQRRQVEANIEEAVQKSLQRVRAPSRVEIEKLSARLDAVARRIEALSR
jgi:polyhydroxyalkanoate synthesis regulator phasin